MMARDDIQHMDIKEFRELGYLQEANRQFFHPHGLALEVTIREDGTEFLSGVWDYRDDPEGIYFGWGHESSPWQSEDEHPFDKAHRVASERAKHLNARAELFEQIYGPAPEGSIPDMEPVVWPEEDLENTSPSSTKSS